MPRELHDREDLLRDARALVPRMMLQVRLAGEQVKLFAGFRGESLSLYFGDEPVFHFNARGELRRAHVGRQLIKADGGRLCELHRTSKGDAVKLAASELDGSRQLQLLAELSEKLAEFRNALEAGQVRLIGQEPPDADALGRLQRWLATHAEIKVAASAHVN